MVRKMVLTFPALCGPERRGQHGAKAGLLRGGARSLSVRSARFIVSTHLVWVISKNKRYRPRLSLPGRRCRRLLVLSYSTMQKRKGTASAAGVPLEALRAAQEDVLCDVIR